MNSRCGAVFIAAAHKSSGKTTVAMGLLRALSESGQSVQPFKKGPDYIDPMWHARACGRPSYNLDFNTQEPSEMLRLFGERAHGAEIALIEGNKGLYDGVALDGSNSNAELAKLLRVPVVLVVDCEGITRGIAPLLIGYRAFDPDVNIAGVILNKVAGSRHEGKLRAAVEHYCDLRVLGAVRRTQELSVRERHLGLTTPGEMDAVEQRIGRIASVIREGIDLNAIRAIAASCELVTTPPARNTSLPSNGTSLRIAIARDAAFGFYYPDDLEAFRAAGCELRFFDALRDQRLPDADGLFIGGGFPETNLAALESNAPLRSLIRSAIEGGLPTYAECGGLMYLCRSIAYQGATCEMVGAIPAEAVMCDQPQGRGQVCLMETMSCPWPAAGEHGGAGVTITCHEFHYAALRDLRAGLSFAYDVVRGDGIAGGGGGMVIGTLLAGFSHRRQRSRNRWVDRFVGFMRHCRGNSTRSANAFPVRGNEAGGHKQSMQGETAA